LKFEIFKIDLQILFTGSLQSIKLLYMKVQVQAVNFNADKKLVQLIEEKVEALLKFQENIIGAEVFLKVQKTSEKENKILELKVGIPGKDKLVKKTSNTFEDALTQAISSMKNALKRIKEKQREKHE
jgi:putative sigma-54 modulation protein